MKKMFTFWFILLFCHLANGQSLTLSYLRIISEASAVVPVFNGGTGSDGTGDSFCITYEHFIRNKKSSLIFNYLKYTGCTIMYFEDGGWIGRDGTPIYGYGFCGGVNIHRVDVGYSYNVFNTHKKFYLKPFLGFGLQKSVKTGVEFWSDAEPVNGPNYFELEPMSAESFNTTQIVPSLGFRTGFVFWKRLDIGLGVQGVYAFKPYQKMYLNYQYKGIVQPMAEYESTGTGLFVTLGVGYRFAKLIK